MHFHFSLATVDMCSTPVFSLLLVCQIFGILDKSRMFLSIALRVVTSTFSLYTVFGNRTLMVIQCRIFNFESVFQRIISGEPYFSLTFMLQKQTKCYQSDTLNRNLGQNDNLYRMRNTSKKEGFPELAVYRLKKLGYGMHTVLHSSAKGTILIVLSCTSCQDKY